MKISPLFSPIFKRLIGERTRLARRMGGESPNHSLQWLPQRSDGTTVSLTPSRRCMDLFYSVLTGLYVVAAVIFLFGAAVFVHEFGHYWVALKCGMKVEEFAIGFGPKAVSWIKNGIVY